jgi:hypothetical protein
LGTVVVVVITQFIDEEAVISGSLGSFNHLGFFLPHIDKAVHHLQKIYNTSNRSISEPSSHKS